jgi:hypothetical protein
MSKAEMPEGHELCRLPSIAGAFPPGWHWCPVVKRVVTADGVTVPIVPELGTAAEREAFEILRRWETTRRQVPAVDHRCGLLV